MRSDKNNKDLEYYKKLQYEVITKKRKNRFEVIIPELAIIEEDESLEKAYEKLESEKEKYFQEMIENDYQDYIKEPEGEKIKKEYIPDLTNYLIKLTITVLVIIFLGVVGMKVTLDKVEHETRSILSIRPENILRELLDGSCRIRDIISSISDERQEEIRLEVRKTIKQIKPFFDEFKPLFKDIPTKKPEKENRGFRNMNIRHSSIGFLN